MLVQEKRFWLGVDPVNEKRLCWHMPTLTEILPSVASLLDVKPSEMGVLAMNIRKEGLITTGGRGLSAAAMRPFDISNLVLAAMVGGYSKDAAAAVAAMRELRLVDTYVTFGRPSSPDETGMYLRRKPPPQLMLECATFGALLDSIFQTLSTGFILDHLDDVATVGGLDVTQPNSLGLLAELRLGFVHSADEYRLIYRRDSDAVAALRRLPGEEQLKAIEASRCAAGIRTIRSISMSVMRALAALLAEDEASSSTPQTKTKSHA